MKHRKWNFAVIALSMAVLLIYVFGVDGAGSITVALKAALPLWIAGAVCLMAVYWLLEALILHLAVKRFHGEQKFSKTLQTAMIGQLFNCITPFASGGQPMQACHMASGGVPLGTSVCALTVKFVIYQFVLTVYSLITLLFRYQSFSVRISHLKYLVLAGFAINTAVIIGLLCICFLPRLTERFLFWSVELLGRMKLVKDREKARTSVTNQLTQFYECFAMIRGNKMLIVRMSVLSALQLTAYFLIPYMLFRSFALGTGSLFSMLVAQAFVLNVSSFVPLPGAAGGAELSFHTMFAMFFPVKLLAISILLWRLITFYLPICVGTVFTFDFSRKKTAPPIAGGADCGY